MVAGALALGGCMRIYPDPELPDVDVVWFEGDCREGTSDVALTVYSLDSDFIRDVRTACSDFKHTFADVPRERLRVSGELYEDSGAVYAGWETDVDTRNGADVEAYMLFGGGANLRVAWDFAMGASCASLGAEDVAVDLLEVEYSYLTYCENTPYFGFIGNGTHTLRLRATSEGRTVAISEPTEPITFGSFDELVDLGTLTLVPCDESCPE